MKIFLAIAGLYLAYRILKGLLFTAEVASVLTEVVVEAAREQAFPEWEADPVCETCGLYLERCECTGEGDA